MIDAGEPEENIAAVIKEFKAPAAPAPRDTTAGLQMAAASRAVPFAGRLAAGVATSPTLPQTTATVGRIMGATAPIVVGADKGGVTGALAGLAASAKGAWAGGKTGYFTGKLMQRAAAPVATVLEKAAPYAQGLSTLSGVQGVLDLAQMAEPNRRDILISTGDQKPPAWTQAQWEQYQKDHPPVLNRIWSALSR